MEPRCSTSRRPGAPETRRHGSALPLGARVLDARPWATPDRSRRLTGRSCRGDAFVDAASPTTRSCRVDRWLVAPATLAAAARQTLPRSVQPDAEPHGVELAALASAYGGRQRAAAGRPRDEPRVVVEQRSRARRRPRRQSPRIRPPRSSSRARRRSRSTRRHRRARRLACARSCPRAQRRPRRSRRHRTSPRAAYDDAVRRVSRAVVERGSLTVSDVRDLLGSTRKYVVAAADTSSTPRAYPASRRHADPGPRVARRSVAWEATTTLDLGEAAPDAVRFPDSQREVETLLAHIASRADAPSPVLRAARAPRVVHRASAGRTAPTPVRGTPRSDARSRERCRAPPCPTPSGPLDPRRNVSAGPRRDNWPAQGRSSVRRGGSGSLAAPARSR